MSAKPDDKPAAERVLFEARVHPRRMAGAAWAALGLGVAAFSFAARDPMLIWLPALCAAIAIREWTIYSLRVAESAIEHLPPHWAPGRASGFANAIRMTARIEAAAVAALEWDGHDGIGIRMRDGRVDVVAIRDRILAADQHAAREAVLRFIERATGKTLPGRDDPPNVAPWIVSNPQRPSA